MYLLNFVRFSEESSPPARIATADRFAVVRFTPLGLALLFTVRDTHEGLSVSVCPGDSGGRAGSLTKPYKN